MNPPRLAMLEVRENFPVVAKSLRSPPIRATSWAAVS
ncbi:hypothetical protein HRbin32_01166 [bacterium HR32]|nr:hypothetical protein HRbin32_01166 [bacterium HR32]